MDPTRECRLAINNVFLFSGLHALAMCLQKERQAAERKTMKTLAAVLLFAGPSTTESPGFFGMHVNNKRDFSVWPEFQFDSLRLHDAGVSWREIETSPGTYDWSIFDQQLRRAKAHNVDVLYDFVRVPEFYTNKPNSQCSQEFNRGNCDSERCAKYGGRNRNGCFPPNDLNRDGSGSNSHFKNFVTAVVNHASSLDSSRFAEIPAWEIWNEVDRETFWQGTNEQLLRMSKDARAIIKAKLPSAIVTTPNTTVPRPLRAYLELAGASEAADAVSLHSYSPRCDPEDDLPNKLKFMNRVRDTFMSGKPIYITEASWGKQENCPDLDQQAAFTARYLLLMRSGIDGEAGVDRLWWYGYDVETGRLSDPDTGSLRSAGKAYREVHNWMTAATLEPRSCKRDSGSRWTCSFKGPNGYQALAVWDEDASRECAAGKCAATMWAAPSKFKRYRDLEGHVATVDGPLPISAKPILVETSAPLSER